MGGGKYCKLQCDRHASVERNAEIQSQKLWEDISKDMKKYIQVTKLNQCMGVKKFQNC